MHAPSSSMSRSASVAPPGALAVVQLLVSDPVALLAVVYGLCFGYVGAFEGVIIATRGVAGGPLGTGAVGPATAVVVGTAALAAPPLSYASVLCKQRLWRAWVAVFFGPLAYVALGRAAGAKGPPPHRRTAPPSAPWPA